MVLLLEGNDIRKGSCFILSEEEYANVKLNANADQLEELRLNYMCLDFNGITYYTVSEWLIKSIGYESPVQSLLAQRSTSEN